MGVWAQICLQVLITFGKNVLEHKQELWGGDLVVQPTILLQLDYCEGVEEMGA